jgi:hypothetical protein
LKNRATGAAVPPKKAASAYNIFGKIKRKEILQKNPFAKVTTVVREMSKAWAEMSKFDRLKYEKIAKKSKGPGLTNLEKRQYTKEL